METSQSKIIKQSLGHSKYSRNTNLLQAQNINKVSHDIIHNMLSLWNRLFCVKSTKIVCSYADFLYTGNTYCSMKSPLYIIVDIGWSPLICAWTKTNYYMYVSSFDGGIVDSLRMVLTSENFY